MSDAKIPAIAIREATPADAPALAALRYRFRSAIGVPVEGEAEFVARATPWRRERIGRPPWRAWAPRRCRPSAPG